MVLQINDKLDRAALATAYAEKKRLQVKDFLVLESAERLFKCLSEETPWGLVYNNDKEVIELPQEKLAQLTPQDLRQIYIDAYGRATDKYQFIYNYYPILTSYKSGKNRDFFLHRVLEYLNSEPMLEFMRTLTGIPGLIKADAQATCYRSNSFLSLHHDVDSQEGRRCAYIINLTRNWQPNWGGYLQFFDEEENVEVALMPTFNALNVFTVPQAHSVSFVPPYCGGTRYAITGWFRDK